ncbi:hypothetical protein PACTADRAFT_48955 [Pachysolen tannophilus NRRL Y-2460]|uniref:Phosphatidate cytidylyltransferase n=1 Tax=Pachysolen tannophilus NRRL Y-2460 TaxID=669874 RepID=A0A1E4TZN1_PACTA|nr:hypothetical protein PACTADRAFT_48955 [Pachysolen tannophilus NRRL Y-2460]
MGRKVSSSVSKEKKNDSKASTPTKQNQVTGGSDLVKKDSDKQKKIQTFIVRTVWTLVMITGMFAILAFGHVVTIMFVLVLQTLVFRECINITTERARIEKLPFTQSLNWYFLVTSIYYLDGETFIYYCINNLRNPSVEIFARLFLNNHKFISYCLYVLGFVFFVASLKKGYYKFQFAQLCITHMTLLLVVFQAHLIINNILSGLIWFLLPVGLVITNDIFAYLCGITFGRTRLIEISPKKTVEGFVGAWVCTALMSILLTFILSKYFYLICPVDDDLTINAWSAMMCDPNPVFISQVFKLPPNIAELVKFEYFGLKPIYFHSMVLATFASLIAPFGGFFASGLKRAFKVKDFGDTIPGHGGITDRMDCQFLMGSFSYLYVQTFIDSHRLNIGTILQMILMNLNDDQIVTLINSLETYLANRAR